MYVIVCTPHPFLVGRIETLTKFSKMGAFTGPQLLQGVSGKERGDFFQTRGAVGIFT